MHIKKIKNYVVLSSQKLEVEIGPKTLDVLDDLKDGVIFTGILKDAEGKLVDNFRSFPRFLDLIIKRFKFLRRTFPQRMRRYLIWDIDLISPSKVDWVTLDLIIVRKDFYTKHLEGFDLSRPLADMYMCLQAYRQKRSVYLIPTLNFVISKKFQSKFWPRLLGFVAFIFKSAFIYRNLNYPSRNYNYDKDLVMNAHKLNNRSYLQQIGASFQRSNKVIQVFEGSVSGSFDYKQPLIFLYDSVVALIVNSKDEIGLITIWRHAPLKFNIKNLFPIFPDTKDLGLYSIEAVRGGAEKSDESNLLSIQRELEEEVSLYPKDVIRSVQLHKFVGNTAWDLFSTQVFVFYVKDSFEPKLEEAEHIVEFKFYSIDEIYKLLNEKKLVCANTQTALFQYLIHKQQCNS